MKSWWEFNESGIEELTQLLDFGFGRKHMNEMSSLGVLNLVPRVEKWRRQMPGPCMLLSFMLLWIA
jgi:hypothetical protein